MAQTFSPEEKERIESIVIDSEIGKFGATRFARISFKDGNERRMPLYFQDGDLAIGTVLDIDKCELYPRKPRYGAKLVEIIQARNTKELHYTGLNFTPEWVVVRSNPLSEKYNVQNLREIKIEAEEYGLAAVVYFQDGTKKIHRISNESRSLSIDETVNPSDCRIVKMRKFHSRYFECVLVE